MKLGLILVAVLHASSQKKGPPQIVGSIPRHDVPKPNSRSHHVLPSREEPSQEIQNKTASSPKKAQGPGMRSGTSSSIHNLAKPKGLPSNDRPVPERVASTAARTSVAYRSQEIQSQTASSQKKTQGPVVRLCTSFSSHKPKSLPSNDRPVPKRVASSGAYICLQPSQGILNETVLSQKKEPEHVVGLETRDLPVTSLDSQRHPTTISPRRTYPPIRHFFPQFRPRPVRGFEQDGIRIFNKLHNDDDKFLVNI